MKNPHKKGKDGAKEDDSLFGLLSMYKAYNTYIRLLVSEEEEKAVLQLTNNPGNWAKIPDEKYEKYDEKKRIEMGVQKLFVKYLIPDFLVQNLGPLLGTKIPAQKANVTNNLDGDGYFILEAPIQYLENMKQAVKRMVSLTPQKKYEIIEKCLAENT